MDNTKVNSSCTNAAPSPQQVHTARLLLGDWSHEPGNASIQIQKKLIGPIWIGRLR